MGLGFTIALTILGAFRELLGAGQIFGMQVMPSAYEPITIFILAPGAFFVLACLVAIQNKVKSKNLKKPEKYRAVDVETVLTVETVLVVPEAFLTQL